MKCVICGAPGDCEHKRMMRRYVAPLVVIVILVVIAVILL